MKNCEECGKVLLNPKAKYCSGACKMRARRGSSVTIIGLPEGVRTWHDTYQTCNGCDGSACPEGFVPNWTRIGKKDEFIKKLKKL
jgi:hypothetical protein